MARTNFVAHLALATLVTVLGLLSAFGPDGDQPGAPTTATVDQVVDQPAAAQGLDRR